MNWGAPHAGFFEFGEVTVHAHDPSGREAAIQITMPCCLMQTVTPALLAAGLIDKYEVRTPFAVWVPRLLDERFKDEVVLGSPQIPEAATDQIAKKMRETLEFFTQLSMVLRDPSDVVPILPLGIYVTFQYRCRTDMIAPVLVHLESMPIAGVQEFRFALATVFAHLLNAEGSVADLGQ